MPQIFSQTYDAVIATAKVDIYMPSNACSKISVGYVSSEKEFSMNPVARASATLLIIGVFTAGPAISGDLDYPPLYKQMNLPELPDATITELGRDNSNLDDGMRIVLQSGMTNGELRSFYESQMADRGWTLQETMAVSRMRAAGMLDKLPFNAVFCKSGGIAYNATTVDMGSVREVDIAISQGASGCSQ
ncbi:MAG: hypothetical protein H6877_11270 [Rhodobiaceae bacterium]|nr:hypothetical protein [Rhodobiaceae bacterium]MCC0017842.1 hypothetical protein [Rhodobiaceae bacterium]MCC0062453.1 hypothetical protein [Rhodobiaceae bacterium]